MKGNLVRVSLWGQDVCLLSWKGGYKERFGKIGSVVSFNPDYYKLGWDLDPIGDYSIKKYFVKNGFSDYFRASEFEGLPRFLCGCIPDIWGNKVFSAWMQKNKIKASEINAVDKLSFIGKRGMGALEFFPESYSSSEDAVVKLEELYKLAEEISNARDLLSVDLSSNPDINDLMAVGMSAGGQHPKAIVAIDWNAMEVRSGQFSQPDCFKQYLLKFREKEPLLSPEVELAYHNMASECGIDMMPSQLLEINKVSHFLTERFDRINGEKIHSASLLAINGKTERYEDLFRAARAMNLTFDQIEQLYRRAVFNFLAYVCDDHDRNFSFLMTKDGKWKLSPAYDVIFSVDLINPFIGPKHAMELGGSKLYEGREQLYRFGIENDINDAGEIIEQLSDVIGRWPSFAQKCGVDNTTAGIINSFLKK